MAALPEDDAGELVDGILEEEEMPSVVHEVIVVWLVRVLGAWPAAHGARVLGSGAKFGLDARRALWSPLVLARRSGAVLEGAASSEDGAGDESD